jgi:hypothetical protein
MEVFLTLFPTFLINYSRLPAAAGKDPQTPELMTR